MESYIAKKDIKISLNIIRKLIGPRYLKNIEISNIFFKIWIY